MTSPHTKNKGTSNFCSLPTKGDDLDRREKEFSGTIALNDLSSLGISLTVQSDEHQVSPSCTDTSNPVTESKKGLLDKKDQDNEPSVFNVWIEGFGTRFPKICTCFLALLGGTIGSLAGIAFKLAWQSLRRIYTSQEGFVAAARAMPIWWHRFTIPIAAGVIGGGIAFAFKHSLSEKAFGPEYVDAVRDGNGRLKLFPNLVRSALAVVVVSGGFTIGREGTMVQFSALVASFTGELLCLSVKWQRLFVAFGAAAGFSAAYLSPLTATMFLGRVLIHQTKNLHEIVAVLLASMISQLLVMKIEHEHIPLYETIVVAPLGFNDQFNAVVVGIIAGLFGAFFQITVEASRGLTVKYIRSFAVRIVLAGLVVGLLSIIRPEVWGNGYSTLQKFISADSSDIDLADAYVVSMLRFFAVLATSAACVPGGVLTPIMMFGGTLGLTVGQLMLIPTAAGEHQLWTMVGMAALLSTMMNAPVIAAVMVFELTHDYNTILVSIPAAVIALLISSYLKSKIMPYVQKATKKTQQQNGSAAGGADSLMQSLAVLEEEKKAEKLPTDTIDDIDEHVIVESTLNALEEAELGMTQSHYGDINPTGSFSLQVAHSKRQNEFARLDSLSSTDVRQSFDSALL